MNYGRDISGYSFGGPCEHYFASYPATSVGYLLAGADEVGTNHPLYNKFEKCWKVMRDSIEGQDAIRDNAVYMNYVQIPAGISDDNKSLYSCKYDSTAAYHYINKAHYIEIVPRILDEVEGRIFSKPYKIDSPDELDINSLDSDGLTFDQYVRWCVREVFALSRFGVLVDWDSETETPILKRYVAESIVNWDNDHRGKLNLVVLEDEVKEDGQIFSHNKIKRRISFTIEESLDGPIVVQRTWYQDNESGPNSFYEAAEPITLERNGRAVSKIPFIFFGGVRPTAPMLKPLAATALDYYDAHASYRHALWWSSNEQPYFNFKEDGGFITADGKEPEGDIEILYGSSTPLLLRDGDLKFAGVKGTGLEHMYRRLKDIKAEMAGMGARSFNSQTASNVKVQTERMQQRAESSVIGSIAYSISIGIKEALDLAAEWALIPERVSFELNQDYTDDFDIKFIPELIEARDATILTNRRIFEFLKNNTDLIPNDMGYEEFQQERKETISSFDFISSQEQLIGVNVEDVNFDDLNRLAFPEVEAQLDIDAQ